METEITSHLQQLEEYLRLTLSTARNLEPVQFHQQPEAGSWSYCQVMEHILQSETGTLGYMLKKSSSGWDTLEDEGEEHESKGKALRERLQSNEKYKAPSILTDPPNTTSVATFEQEWPALRERLTAFVHAVEPHHYRKLVFKQPLAGMLTLPSTTAFLAHHFQHHMPQFETILQHLRS